MSADRHGLADVATSVADGTAVDWERAELVSAPDDRPLVRHLRLVEQISRVYRTLPDETSDDAGRDAAEPAGERWGRLVLTERVGHGMSCEVYRAWDTALHREVALKLFHQDTPAIGQIRQRVLEEARRLARLDHDNIVRVYGAEEHGGRVGFWMELVRGESLEQIVHGRGAFGPVEASSIGQQLCAALAAVHAAGLLHRDVKATNVMRAEGGRIVLMDFGTGEALQQDEGTARFVGTPLYLAPEIFAGRPASVRTDLYSLGVLLFYLVTGKYPHSAASMENLAAAHVRGHRRQLRDVRPDLPQAFVDVVERALSDPPERRYRSAGEMEAALRQAADSGLREEPRSTRGTGTKVALAAALGLVLIVVALIVWNRQNRPDGAAIERIAVLPLVDISPSAPPHLADALTDELISVLGQTTALQVVSRSSVMPFKASPDPPRAIAEKLGVDALLEGTVLTKAERPGRTAIRVNVRLIAAGSEAQLWTRAFDGELSDTRRLHRDVARAIAKELRATLKPGAARAGRDEPQDEQATAAYLLGRYHLGHAGNDRTRQALDAFQRAIQLDPMHAAAHAAAARCYVTLGFTGALTHGEARARALASAARAADLDPRLPDAHVALADLKFYYDWNWPGAETDYLQVLALNPSFTHARAQYARFLAALGRLADALTQAAEAVDRDPHAPEAVLTLGLIQYYNRDYDAALQTLAGVLTLDPGNARAHLVIGRVHEAAGRPRQAVAETGQALVLATGGDVSWRLQLLRQRAIAGFANVRAEVVQALAEIARQKLYVAPEHLAYVHLALGERSVALDLLERAVDARDPAVLWFAVDPRLDSLRDEPRFVRLLERIGLS